MTALDVLALVASLAVVCVLIYVADTIQAVEDEDGYNTEQGAKHDESI